MNIDKMTELKQEAIIRFVCFDEDKLIRHYMSEADITPPSDPVIFAATIYKACVLSVNMAKWIKDVARQKWAGLGLDPKIIDKL